MAVALLLQQGWLSRQPAAFREEVIVRGLLVEFDPGEVVYRFGDPGGGLYGLVSGVLRVSTAPQHSAAQFIQLGIVEAWPARGRS